MPACSRRPSTWAARPRLQPSSRNISLSEALTGPLDSMNSTNRAGAFKGSWLVAGNFLRCAVKAPSLGGGQCGLARGPLNLVAGKHLHERLATRIAQLAAASPRFCGDELARAFGHLVRSAFDDQPHHVNQHRFSWTEVHGDGTVDGRMLETYQFDRPRSQGITH